ncbi:hypothetical protein [Hymenobacter lapidarius]|uniref:hypothetical protein n=1 Tax=Hymenobacter lapidarius TaxID=1908237 RepID=UPI0009F1A205|nr:hypothetical protein [Hymenobacter lapidarius]
MKTRSFLLLVALLFAGQLVASSPASAQVVIRAGYHAPRRVHYAPRYYAPPRPAVVYAAPPRPVVVPAPYYAPRRYYAPPRAYHGHRGHYGRRR